MADTDRVVTVNVETGEFTDPRVLDLILSGTLRYIPSPGSGVDIGPTIQQLRDSGLRHFNFDPEQRYYLDSPVFHDLADPRDTLIFDFNNARLDIGPNGSAKASDYAGDSATEFSLFVNTKRSGYNASTRTVTTGENATSTGSFVATVGPGIIINDADIRGNSRQVRFLHLNNSTVVLTGRLSFMQGGVATRGYCDSNYIRARLTNPFIGSATEQPSIIKQEGNGDNLTLIGNADSRALVADLRYCRGAVINSVGGGVRLVDCANIVYTGHTEGDEHLRRAPVATVTRSQVRFLLGEFWSSNTAKTFHTVVVNDGSANADATSDILFDGTISRNVYRIDSVADERQMSDLHIIAMNTGSRIQSRGYTAATQVVSLSEIWRVSPLITSDSTAIQAAINSGAAHLPVSDWVLRRVEGNWQLRPLQNPDLLTAIARTSAPTVEFGSQYTSIPGAVPGGVYNYYFAEIDENGVMGPRTLATNVVVSAVAAAVRIGVTLRRPGRLAIWRQVEGQPVDRYIALGCPTGRVFLHDTGTNVNKRPWVTSGFPDRPGTSGTSSVDTIRFNGKTIALS